VDRAGLLPVRRTNSGGSIGIGKDTSSTGFGVLANYAIPNSSWNLSARVEDISSSGTRSTARPTCSTAREAAPGPFTFTPSYQVGVLFGRAEVSFVGASSLNAGARLRQEPVQHVADPVRGRGRHTVLGPAAKRPAPLPGRGLLLRRPRRCSFVSFGGFRGLSDTHTHAPARPHPRCQRFHRQLPHPGHPGEEGLGGLRMDVGTTSSATASATRGSSSSRRHHHLPEWIEYHVKKCDAGAPAGRDREPGAYVRDPLRVFELDFEANLEIVRKCAKYRKTDHLPVHVPRSTGCARTRSSTSRRARSSTGR